MPVLPGRIACQRGSLCNEPAQFHPRRRMSSRLFQSVREQNGLCYSVYTFTTPHLDTGLLSIYTGLGQETERKALDLILRELDEFCQNGPAPDELSRWPRAGQDHAADGAGEYRKPHDDHRPQ